ncbi:MAG: ATP-binding cassette domain-containing protein [Candidatus Aminicenantes bacterium]|nr:ATP-binding cassette domain-containing protein [Candidatus Aminicenantes bacterium]NIM83025.1 ATP-binding cassette domain-containing protein [Candidatus Aminicenantes bacterium]NIN22412.1 ATP-binding cassette domain-containing protein [Candidatus Aminicenantes bacterium]NIN46180.1 ATP-binding cassette domain-containing protein [Candidatus Aminicenantes bacterium]NIN89017.1 ATP-binding cassette domain-containing protein [Candidatus Aminicenantes bacterium]
MVNEDRLLSYVKPFVSRFIFALFFMAMIAAFTVLLPLVIELLVNELSIRSGGTVSGEAQEFREFIMQTFNIAEKNLAPLLPVMLLAVFFGQAVFTFLSLYLMKTLGLKVIRNIRDKLYRNLVHQSVDFLSKAKTGDLTSRISNDIEKIRFAVSETLAVYIRESLILVGLIIYIFLRDWQMSLFSMVILPIAAMPMIYFGKRVKKRGIQSQETIAELSNFLAETVGGNKIVKAYNMEEYEIEKFRKMNQKHYKINSKIAMVYSLASPVMTFIGGLVAFAVFSVGTQRMAVGSMDPGKFAAFFLAILMMYNPIKKLSQAHNDYQQGISGYYRVRQIFSATRPVKDIPTAVELKEVKGEVTFKDVSFSYREDIPVIRNISFFAKPNRMIALVGGSGSGKSTLMYLLLRFYEPDSGEILIDGKDILHVTHKSLREAISLVTQDVFIFNDTIENNIAYGRKNYTFDEVKRAAEIARAADFIEELPLKYQTIVGERGAFLSMGQRQRISIARAVLKKPAILIFDEATSSLDSESEKLIQEAMTEVMKGRTTFVIAHRLSTILEADKILVIENGEIKESGSHKELLVNRGLYYSLYNLQFPEMDIIM